jgi:hypothetical protein
LGLKNFEKKVLELTGADKLITKDADKKVEPVKKVIPTDAKEKKNYSPNKKVLKIAAIAICALIVLSVIYVVFLTDIFSSEDSGSSDNNDIDNDSVDNNDDLDNESEIEDEIIITTTDVSERINNQRPEEKDAFYQGETVYVDCELNNITHNNTYNFTVFINVELDFTNYYQDTQYYKGNTSDEIIYFIAEIQTNESWNPNYYEIEVAVYDNVVDKNYIKTSSFKII